MILLNTRDENRGKRNSGKPEFQEGFLEMAKKSIVLLKMKRVLFSKNRDKRSQLLVR
jgi:hypothetical protein